MARIPYEIVAIEADKLLNKVLSARSIDEMTILYDKYMAYLQATGWDSQSFDQETLIRVDKSWDNEAPKKTNLLN